MAAPSSILLARRSWPGQQDLVNRVLGVVPATVAVNLDPASDSGASNHDGITNVTNPTFDVQVNQAGTIGVDFDGNGTIDATLSVQVAGTYQFTAPTLANGTYTATATFTSATGGTAQSSTTYTIDTDRAARHGDESERHRSAPASPRSTVTFSEPVDLNTFTPSAITLTGPGGAIAVSQPQLVSGSTYNIGFATQTAQGAYTLTIAPSVTDLAGNEMDQNQNGINGEPTDSFTGSFTIAPARPGRDRPPRRRRARSGGRHPGLLDGHRTSARPTRRHRPGPTPSTSLPIRCSTPRPSA